MIRDDSYFPVHAHTAFSPLDGIGKVADHVARVAELGQPAFTTSDHGNMAATVQAYTACKKAGIGYYPGCEFYLVQDVTDPTTRDTRYHLNLMALDFVGYQALVKLQTLSFTPDRFHRKPLIDLSDLAFLHDEGYSDHLALTTGCYSGIVTNQWQGADPPAHAHSMVRMLARWFPHLYVELHNHGITWPEGHTDAMVARSLHDIAQMEGLPVVVGGDSHYIYPSQQAAHDLMKDICYFGDGEDNHFNGGPYHLLSAKEAFKAFPKDMRADLIAGHADLLGKHRVAIPTLDKFTFNVPKMLDDPDTALEKAVYKGLDKRGKNTLPYLGRAADELKVIKTMGFANYHHLVKIHVTDYARQEGIIVNLRGSGNGSLVNYALGISEVDPLEWGTDFDRYLSVKRKKAPDLDIDVSRHGRAKIIAHLRAVFPTLTQIATYSQIGMTIDEETGEEKGSVVVQYRAAMGKLHPGYDGRIFPKHEQALADLALEHAYKSMGVNAAGFVLPGATLPIDALLPLGRVISSDTTVAQFNKDDVESLGYVKLDILGLRALQTLNGTLTRIGRQANDWDWIPYDDKEACALMRSGNGTGLFQFEGWSTAKGGKEMGVRSTKDVILALALYRPALMNGGQKDQYLANRKARKADKVRLHPIFDPVLQDTEYVPIFQEQVTKMLVALGMSFEDYNDLMSAIKASNGFIRGARETFKRVRPIFYDLCDDAGLDAQESDDAWHAVVGFTEYGFNRAHSTSYGLMAYRSAYLKTHYPLEYMASLLDVWADVDKKVTRYITEARRLGITVVKADVNESAVSWDIDTTRPNALRKGLVSLPGIGETVAQSIVENRPPAGYADVADFIGRVPARPVSGGKQWKATGTPNGVMKVLLEQNAFRSLGVTAP